jgi:CheY-like chemotaxis protein
VQLEDTEAPLPILYDNQEIMPRAETSLRILLAEDNEINQQLVITVLEERGHSVVLATNGHEAVDLFKKATFDLILMDVQMPGKDGYEACSDIRQLPGGRHIPIYAVTAHALPEDRRRCIDAGMNDYLTKPIRIEEFARVVEAKVLRNETLPREPLARVQTRRTDSPHMPSQEKTRLIPPSVLPPKSFDLAALRVMVNNNDKLVLQLAASFARQASEDRANMRQALTDGNATLMERSAHRLKGSALSLSAAPLARVAQTLETSGRQNNLAIASGVWSEFEQVYDALTADLAALNC